MLKLESIQNKKLFQTVVIKAHELPCITAPLIITILATDLANARHILKNVRGYRRNKPYPIKEVDKQEWFRIPFKLQNKLLERGYYIEE
jgi:hypothetical protein